MNAPLNLNPADVLVAEYERLQIEGTGYLRNPRAEEIILQNVHNSAYYSVHVLQGRWPQFEAALQKKSVDDYDPDDISDYLRALTGDFSLKRGSSHQDVIDALDRAPKVSNDGESTFTSKKTRLATMGETYSLVDRKYDPEPAQLYYRERDRRHTEGDGFSRNPETEAVILKDPFHAVWYANHVLKHRWPELERRLESVPEDYRWNSGTKDLAAEAMIEYNLEVAQRPIKAVERLIYSFKAPENITDPEVKNKTHGAAYDSQKQALFPGCTSTSNAGRAAFLEDRFWTTSAEYREAISSSAEAASNLHDWNTSKGRRFLGNLKGCLEGISGMAKGAGKLPLALPVIRWVTSCTFWGAFADIGLGATKFGEHAYSQFSPKEFKKIKGVADRQEQALAAARSQAVHDAGNLVPVVFNAINSTAAAAFKSHYALRTSAKMLSDTSPALAGYNALAFLHRELGKVASSYTDCLETAIEALSYEFRHEAGRAPFEARQASNPRKDVLSAMFLRFLGSDTSPGAREEIRKIYDVLESASLLLNADAKLAHILFERSGRSDLPSDTKMLLLPHEDFKDVVRSMIEGEFKPYTREMSVASRPAKISDIHDELEVISLLIQARVKTHPHLAKQVDQQLEAISGIKVSLAKIQACGSDQIQLDMTLRSPNEYLLKLSVHVKTHFRRLELGDGIRPALQGKFSGLEPVLSTDETKGPKY
jgi:hypothetical protein